MKRNRKKERFKRWYQRQQSPKGFVRWWHNVVHGRKLTNYELVTIIENY